LALYFGHVESTLKKGCNVKLGQRTVIVGGNGSGKSSIVQSLELAANGWASDMEGRARVKQGTALARLFPPDGARYARATLSNGAQFLWELEDNKTGGFKRPEHTPPALVRWPVQDLMDVLRGDSNTVSAWLEQQVVGGLTEADLLSALPPAVRDLVKEFMKRQRKTDFIALAKDAKQEAKNLRVQATRSEKTIDSMTEGIAPPLLDSARKELEAKLAVMTAPQVGITKAEHVAARAEIERFVQIYMTKQSELEKLVAPPANISEAVNRLVAAGTLIQQHTTIFGKYDCWVCGNEKKGAIDAQTIRLTEAMAQVHPKHQEGARRAALVQEQVVREADLKQRAEAFKKLKVAEVPDDGARRAIMARLAMDDAAKRTWFNADAARREADQFRSKADLLTLAGNALEKAGKQFLEKSKLDFESTVSAFLPEGERIGVDLESARFGLLRNGEIHSALSGAEWSRVLLALAAAQERNATTPCVLVPEDRAWDARTLSQVMQALATCAVQVLIMSTVAPAAPVEGWTLVELS